MPDQHQLPPDAQLIQILFGFMATRSVSAAAELNIADLLKDGPRYYTDIAEAVDADQRSLHLASIRNSGQIPKTSCCPFKKSILSLDDK